MSESSSETTDRPVRRLLAAAAGIGILGMPVLTTPPPSPSASMPASAPAAPTDESGLGTRLYQQSCASCHGQQGEGTQRGPALSGVGPADTDFQLSTGRMPLGKELHSDMHGEPAFSQAEISALVQHVASFPPGGGPPIPVVTEGDVRSGRELFLTYCSACHSAAGVGATLNNGRIAPSLSRATSTQIGEAVRVGPGLMPQFPPDVVSDDDVDAIAGYVAVLQNKHGDLDRGGWSLGRLGPFTEGAVAWVFGLAAVAFLARRLGKRAR
ncbi:c-type cytochrome [Actinoplanes sp. NPDC051343]|uniref:c-type cytochrome n=1 Tax=Actinoplanes sp. NPDC051343 TaxID=3363906 RepID=UPI0037A51369